MDKLDQILSQLRDIKEEVDNLKRKLVPYAGINQVGDIKNVVDDIKRSIDELKRR